MIKKIIKKLKDKKGSGLSVVLFSIVITIIFFTIWLLNTEHNIYVDTKDSIERGIKSACKASVLQISKKDNPNPVDSDLDSIFNADRDSGSEILLKSKFKNAIQIDKERANKLIEKIICDNTGIGVIDPESKAYPNGTVETLREHLVVRAYTEPQDDGSLKLTMYSPGDYGTTINPVIKIIEKNNENIMKELIEENLNSFLTSNPVGGKISRVNITNTGAKAIPELSISKPCIMLYLQDYPVKTFTKQKTLNVFYLSPGNIERKIK